MSSIENVRALVAELGRSSAALSALGAAIDARCGGELDPRLEAPLRELLAVIGLPDGLGDIPPAQLRPVLGEIRGFSALQSKWTHADRRRPGWNHTESEILSEVGQVTIPFAHGFRNVIAPKLGLVERLESPGAAFLDIGVGVGLLAIEFCRLWPELRVVGLDIWAPSLALARGNVAAAGLEGRIELREQAGQDLPDEAAFDVAWMASSFMAEATIPEAVRRVHRALRPGGWILFATARPGDPLSTALARLRTVAFGGTFTTPDEIERLLRQHGYADVSTLPGPPSAPVGVVAGRRA